MQFLKTLSIILMTVMIFACSQEQSKYVVATFDDEYISYDEYKKAFLKNESERTNTKRDSVALAEFLDLYVGYKMKLADAKERGYDKEE